MYKIHTAANGKVTPLIQMSDIHLLNTLNFRFKNISLTALQKKFAQGNDLDIYDMFQSSIFYFFEGLRRDSTRDKTQDLLANLFPEVDKGSSVIVFNDNFALRNLYQQETHSENMYDYDPLDCGDINY